MAGQQLALRQLTPGPAGISRDDRRAERRLAWIKRGIARKHGGATAPVTLRDLSETGCCLTSEVPYEVGTWLQLRFQTEVMVAQVVWNRGSTLGCRFDQELPAKRVRALTLANF